MSITLDTIRKAADAKYGAFEIVLDDPANPVKLLNPLRLSAEKRKALSSIQGELDVEDVEDVDQVGVFERMIRTVAETEGQADALLDAVGGDLAVLAELVTGYSEGTQVGEASASAN